MPDDPYADFQKPKKEDPYAEFQQSASADDFDPEIKKRGSTQSGLSSEDKGFLSTLWQDAKGMGKVANAALNPFANPLESGKTLADVGKGMVKAQGEQFTKGADAFKDKRYSEAAGYFGAGLLPGIGPAASQIGEEIGDQKYGQAAAHGLEIAGPSAFEALPAVKIGGGLKNVNKAAEEAALKSVEGEVRMTPGQRTGQIGRQKVEKNLTNIPQTAGRAQEFYAGQEQELGNAMRKRIDAIPGKTEDIAGVAEKTRLELGKVINANKSAADQLYNSVRADVAKAAKPVKVGVDKNGKPIMKVIEAPVELNPIRKDLLPVYRELLQTFPEAQRQYNPAWNVLDNFMKNKTTHMGAMDFDKFLGAIKSITRNGKSPYLNSQAQGLANKVITAGEQEFSKALQGAGPDTLAKIQKARQTVKEYHDVAEFLGSFDKAQYKEAGSLYQKLVASKERSLETLQYIQQKAPQVTKTIGKTFLDQLYEKATAEGGFGRTEGLWRDWNNLGPQTKEILFGKGVAEDMDKFFLAAKRLHPAEGSATGGRLSAFATYGDIGGALVELVTGTAAGHPGPAAAIAATALYKTRLQPEILARISFKPAGAKLLKNAMEVPINSPKFNETMRALAVMAEDEKKGEETPGSRALKKP